MVHEMKGVCCRYRVVSERFNRLRGRCNNLSDGWVGPARCSRGARPFAASPAICAVGEAAHRDSRRGSGGRHGSSSTHNRTLGGGQAHMIERAAAAVVCVFVLVDADVWVDVVWL